MARLPQPGGDENTWGDLLNEFLTVAHNADGTIKASALASKADDTAVVHNAGNETVAGVKTFSSSPVVPTPTLGSDAANKTYVDNAVIAGAPDATTTNKGILQLAGDLGGTATSPTVPGLAAKANDNAVVHLTGAETVAGVKTFSSSPVIPAPTNNTDAATKLYVDTAASSKEPVITAGTTAQYWRGDKSWQTLDKAAVGLNNVDNTSDASKPISSATQTALDAKANATDVIAFSVAL